MSSDRAVVLLTGVGSLVGKAVLDSLDHRRDQLSLVGMNLDAGHPNMTRCDSVLLAPPADDLPAYREAVVSAIAETRADLVIPCRDPDVPLLAHVALDYPDLGPRLLVGTATVADVVTDKIASSQWAAIHGVPFAASVPTGQAGSQTAGRRLVAEHGFPLIAKPARGSGSLGVRVLTGESHLEAVLPLAGLVIQPFYDAPPTHDLDLDVTTGFPLFWEVPVRRQFGAQGTIGPDGSLGPGMIFKASQRLGRTESLEPWYDAGLQSLAETAMAAFVADGWRGPLNMQARPTPSGWVAIEFNGRFSGGTSCRYWLGLDEVGWSVNAWLGRPLVPPPPGEPARRVERMLSDYPVWQ